MPLTRAPKTDADTTVPLPPAPRRTPVLEATTGLVTRAWATWFDLLWKRNGEAHAPSNAELDEGMTSNESALAALQTELDATQAELAATQADLTATQASLASTQAELAATQATITALQAELDGTQTTLAATQAELDQTQLDLAATQAELDATQGQLASDLPPGTAYTVSRYQSDGVGVESTPGVATTVDGKVGLATTMAATLDSGATYQVLNMRGAILGVGLTTGTGAQERAQGMLQALWGASNDATRRGRLILWAYDAVQSREGLRVDSDGTAARVGFLGSAGSIRITLPAAATDPATTMALANALRSMLITFGLGA